MTSTYAQEILIALGSNLGSKAGDAAQTVGAALVAITGAGLHLKRVSRFFATPCFPAGAGPDYVNACAVFDASHDSVTPQDVLSILHQIEAEFDRERIARWGSRTLDLDLLAMGSAVLPNHDTYSQWQSLPLEQQLTDTPPELILPHPRLQERAFVLVPLCDVAAGWRHPVLGRSTAQMTRDLPEDLRAEVVPLS